MATPITNTQITDDTIGLRESLSDIIGKVDPVDTPLYSNSAKTKATAKVHEFQQWAIEDSPPVTIDYKLEGEEPDRNTVKKTELLSNACSILFRDYIVSGTLVAVDVAGRVNEMAWQRITRALELRSQVETALMANNAKVLTNLPRENAGLPAYADGGTGTIPSPVNTPDDTPDALEAAMLALSDVGVTGRTCIMLPASKKAFTGTAHTSSAKNIEAAITDRDMPAWSGAVSVYLTDLGPVQLVVDRYMDTTQLVALVMDERHVRIAEIPGRVFADEPLAPSGDAEQRLIVWEGTLEVNAPAAVASMGTVV